MNTLEKSQRADRRFCDAAVNSPELVTGLPGVAIRQQRKRGRVHILFHQGKGRDGGYSSSSMDAGTYDRLLDAMIDAGPATGKSRDLPAVRRLLDAARWAQQNEIEELRHEAQLLRWRILHLEREQQKPAPVYSDATALVLLPGLSTLSSQLSAARPEARAS
jgi:hypothetical protein